jgi:hypothetical protein
VKDNEYYKLICNLKEAIQKLQLAKVKIDFQWETNPHSALTTAELCSEAVKLIMNVAQEALNEVDARKSVFDSIEGVADQPET